MNRRSLPAIALILQLSLSALAQTPNSQAKTEPAPQQPAPAAKPSPTPQTPEPDDDVVKITTNLVQVDAVVTDKSGKPITDLTKDEIQIFEDGRPQKITHFSYVVADTSSPAPPKKAATPVDKTAPPVPPVPRGVVHPEQIRRTIALVVDDLGLSFQSIYYVRRALKKFVDEQMQPGDLVAIIRTSGGIGALQQFTADKSRLYSAIEHLKWFASGRSGITPFAPLEDNSHQTDEAVAANEELNQFREDTFAVGTLGAVRYVVDGLRELPGRKSVLLISDGFKIYNRDDPTANLRALNSLKGLIDRASRASVVIYTMNATGLQTLGFSAADNAGGRTPAQLEQAMSDRRSSAFDSQEGMDYLAKETGGLAIRNTNDLGGGIRKVLEDQRGYYLIGYRPDESTFDAKTGGRKFHKLSWKVTRPGKYSIRTRNGFYGVSDDELKAAANTPRQQIIKALVSPFGSAGVHVRLTSLFANDPKFGSLMRSMLYINGGDLTFTDEPDGWHKAEFDVVALTFGDNGGVVEAPVNRTYTARARGEDYQRLLREGFVYFLTVPIKKPGAYQLRAAVRDHGSDRIGSASQFVEVPDIKKNRLTLSGIVMTGTDPGAKKPEPKANVAAGNQAGEKDGEQQEITNPQTSAAVRQFRRGQLMDYGVVIYNAHLDKGQGQPQLELQVKIFRDGKPVFTGKEQPLNLSGPSDLKRLGAAGTLKLGGDMVPGEYVFQVIVKDLLTDEKHRMATQWMDFEIVK
jgi:VWFA-related protein